MDTPAPTLAGSGRHPARRDTETSMTITEALARASAQAEIYGLLCAYFEAVRAHDSGLTLPESCTRLPLAGIADVARRHADARELYARCLGETGRGDALLAEYAETAGAALARLHALEAMLERAA